MKKLYYFLYKTTNLINNKYYYGVHSTDNINDGYLGSGTILQHAINKYGRENFHREIIKFFDSADDMFQAERETITEAMVNDSNCYNIKPGGLGNKKGYIIVNDNGVLKQVSRNSTNLPCIYDGKSQYINSDGIIKFKSKTDPDVLSGEWVSIRKGTCAVITPEGIRTRVSNKDPKFLSGEYISISKGKTIYKKDDNACICCTPEEAKLNGYTSFATGKCAVTDKNGNHFYVDVNDERIKTGELVSTSAGLVPVMDSQGNRFKVYRDDERIKTGELQIYTCFKNKRVMKDKDGNILFVNKDDERIKTGELVGRSKGMAPYKDRDGNLINTTTDDPRVISGELVGIQTGSKCVVDIFAHKIIKVSSEKFAQLDMSKYVEYTSLKVQFENGDIFNSYVGDSRLNGKKYYRNLYYTPIKFSKGVDMRMYLYENDERVVSGKYVIIDNDLNRKRAPDLFADNIILNKSIFEIADELYEKYKVPAKHLKLYPTFIDESLKYLKTIGINEADFTHGYGEIYWFIKNRRTCFPTDSKTGKRTKYIDKGKYYNSRKI